MLKKINIITIGILTIAILFFTINAGVKAYSYSKKLTKTVKKERILKGKLIVLKSGCIRCHSFVKGYKIDGVISLADWGDKHLTLKQTEKAIRSCKADIYCSQILTNKQVEYTAYYLNSLRRER